MPAIAQEAGSETLETVVVTGSRLIASGATSPTPLTTVPVDTLLELTPTSIPDALNKLPEFIGSQTPRRPGGGGSNLASNVLNLRGFGAQRTLVLLDGHRVPPANGDGTVDVDTLPEMLMSRVDIVTGGASAVYGSDAIAGVVNYILDKKFTGVKIDANAGISDFGDGAGYKIGIAAGTPLFGGRGHIEGSVSRENRDKVSNSDRPYGNAHWTATGSGTTAAPYGVTAANRQDSSFGGKITQCSAACPNALGMQFVSNGVLGPFDPGTNSTTSNIGSGGSGAYAAYSTALSSMRTTQSFGRFSYDVLDNLQFYVQSSYNQAYSTGWHFPNKFNAGSTQASNFYKNNPFLTTAVQTALGNNGLNNATNTFGIGEYIDYNGAAGTNGTQNLNVNKMVSIGNWAIPTVSTTHACCC
jgi:outer membrane receptor protein involved in Fe transport